MTPQDTPPSSDPLFGNAASDLLREAAGSEGKPPSDPRFWQPPTPEELQSRLSGYVIEAFLARGGMGAVYRGMQTSLERAVAIKILPSLLSEHDASFAQRFKQEARAMAQLNHPGIVKVFDFGEMSDGTLYFIMEFIDGTDVGQMVARQGRLSSAHALAVTAHVCDALQYAHELGIVHRDIKPANIMVGIDGQVKVADFGLAKSFQSGHTSLTVTGHVMGTVHFVAPEALTLGSSVDHRADIYAMGVMLYQMLTGRLPQGIFEMPSLLVKGLDPRYDLIVASAMREDRNARYQSIREMRRALDGIITQPIYVPAKPTPASPALATIPAGPPAKSPTSPRHTIPSPAKTSSASTWWLALATLLFIGGIAWLKFNSQPWSPGAKPLSERASAAPIAKKTPAPLAAWKFNSATPEPGASLSRAPMIDGVLELDGKYQHRGKEDPGYRAVFSAAQMNPQAFTIAVRLRPDSFDDSHRILLMGGTSGRWMGLDVDTKGVLRLTAKNHKFHSKLTATPLRTGAWTTLTLSFDASLRQAVVYVDGRRTDTVAGPATCDPWDEVKDREWTFTDYSNGRAFKGAVDELVIFDGVLSDDEVAVLQLGGNAPVSLVAASDGVIALPLISSGGMSRMGGYRPQSTKTSSTAPALIRKAPTGLSQAEYGSIKLGPASAQREHAFIIDQPDSLKPRLFVDSNADGDLTNDPAAKWERRTYKKDDGKEEFSASGSFSIELAMPGEAHLTVQLSAYRFGTGMANRPQKVLLYYSDYVRAGTITLAGKSIPALLCDDDCKGDFSAASSSLRLDLNGDKRYDWRGETFKVKDAFNIGGTNYEIAELTPSGAGFRIISSSRSAPESKPLPTLEVGKQSLPFDATTLDGAKISMPSSFKGKVLLLDFWATWCPPCVTEVPHVVTAHQKHRSAGFEILGISLDEDKNKLTAFLKEKNIIWPQVFDGQGWKAAIAKLYNVQSIPATYLIDGDTGRILAVGARGTGLEPAIAKALAEKKR
jgi:serine/threonine protein kinase/thiol-disulfide isomerase/thioredoxin